MRQRRAEAPTRGDGVAKGPERAVSEGEESGRGLPSPAPPASRELVANPLARGALVVAGCLFVGLGALGAVLPLLPTTPFLLLAAACFLRSSDGLHRWLHENRLFGESLRRYRAGEGLGRRQKTATLFLLWGTLSASAIWAVPAGDRIVRLVLFAVGAAVTAHLLRLPTRP